MNKLLANKPPFGGKVRGYAEGGEVEEEVVNTDPVGTAKEFLSQVQGAGAKASPTRQSVKRSLQRAGGGASAPKEMGLSVGALSAPSAKGAVLDLADKGSARQQMEELARVYQLKARAAQGKSRGLMAATFEAPTLEGAALTKNTLAKKRFAGGGEVSSSVPQQINLDSLFELPMYDTEGRKYILTPEGRKYIFDDPGAGSDNNPPLSPQTIAFFDNETPAQRDTRMMGVDRAIGAGLSFLPGPMGLVAGLSNFANSGNLSTLAGGIANFFSPPGSQPNFSIPVDNVGSYAGTPAMGQTSYESGVGNPGESDGGGGYSQSAGENSEGAGPSGDGVSLARGGLVRRVEGSPKAGEAALPEPTFIESSPATRTFLNVLAGRREPLTEKDFTPSEHAAMLEVIRNSEARGKSPKGRVDYGDYPSAENAGPGYKDIRHTLGGFGYQRDPEGGVTILDKYDFHGPRVAEYEKMGGLEKAASTAKNALLEFLKQGGPRDLAGEVGRAYIGTKGPEIKIRIPPPVKRAKGSPEGGETAPPEPTQEEIDAANKPSFRISKSGIGRPEGKISRQLRAGDAYVNMAKGFSELPYNLAGAPMDLIMLARQGLTGQTPAGQVGTSDYIKKKMTEFGIRQAPPTDPTAKGFYTAGDLLSNLTNPAAVPRKVGPAIERGVKAGATEVGRQLDRAIMDNAGPLAKAVPDAARPMYISRAPGGYFPTSRANEGGILSELDKAFDPVLKEAKSIEDPEKRQALATLFNQKAKDFYTKQAGSIQDPLRKDILSGALKFPDEAPIADLFPRLLQKGAAQGDLQALRLLERNYDKMLGIRSVVPRREGSPVIQDVVQSQIMSNIRDNLDKVPDAQLVAYSGRKPGAGPTAVADIAAEIRQKVKDNPTLFSTVLEPRIARTIFASTRNSSDLEMARYPGLYGTTSVEAMVRNPAVPAPANYDSPMPPNYFLPDVEMAIEKGQPIQDITSSSIQLLGMTPEKMLDQARQMSAEELNRMGFVDFLKKAYAGTQQLNEYESALPKVKKLIEAGKPPPADIMTYGVQNFLPTADDFRWVKVTKPDAVKAIAAGMSNSVASYATSKTYGSLGKGRTALDNGDAEVYALYDKNNVPHMTVEYLTNKPGVPDDKKNTIAQLTGNGPLTGNATPEKYAPQIVDLLNNIRPSSMPASVKKLLEKTGQKQFLAEEVLAPLYFGVPIQPLRAADDNLLQQLNAPAGGLLRRLGLR